MRTERSVGLRPPEKGTGLALDLTETLLRGFRF